MLLFDKEENGIRHAVWEVRETTEQLLMLLPDGNSWFKEAKDRFKSESRIKEWIAVRVLLYHLMEKNAKISYKENGAPYLESSNKEISISHTKGYVCIALSENYRIGIDIERVANKVERVKDRFINECEQCDTLIKMLLIWSAKESMYKLLQIEGLDFLKDLKVCKFEESEQGVFIAMHKGKDYKVLYAVNKDFVLTITYTER